MIYLFYLLGCANITFCVFCLRNRFLCKKNNINPIQSGKMAIITNINLKRSDNKSKMVWQCLDMSCHVMQYWQYYPFPLIILVFAGVTGGRQFITFTGRQITENVFSYYENDLAGTSHSLPSPIGSMHYQSIKHYLLETENWFW